VTKQADLLAYLFDGRSQGAGEPGQVLSGELLAWMDTSARFTAFVEIYRDKIRKKIRVTQEPDRLLDLRAELELAARLLADRRLAVVYEPYPSAAGRGPDFAVTYRANLVFNVEVARTHVAEGGEERLLRILLDKLGQMQPGQPNLLAVQARADLAQSIDLRRLMQGVKTRVEGKDPAFYTATRYSGPAAFYKDFLHLSGILLWPALDEPPQPAAGQPVQAWANRQARPGLDGKIIRLVAAALQAAPHMGT
jgi:hypothetical protein